MLSEVLVDGSDIFYDALLGGGEGSPMRRVLKIPRGERVSQDCGELGGNFSFFGVESPPFRINIDKVHVRRVPIYSCLPMIFSHVVGFCTIAGLCGGSDRSPRGQ